MSFEKYRALLIILTLFISLIVLSPLIGFFIPQRRSERFSEFWLLGNEHKAEGYPYNISSNEKYKIYLGVENHMGESEYYMIYIKFSNTSGTFINSSTSTILNPLYEEKFFLKNDEIWEQNITLRFDGIVFRENALYLNNISINDNCFPINTSTIWDVKNNGFFYYLFFELWRYDVDLNYFRFDNRLLNLSLRMNG